MLFNLLSWFHKSLKSQNSSLKTKMTGLRITILHSLFKTARQLWQTMGGMGSHSRAWTELAKTTFKETKVLCAEINRTLWTAQVGFIIKTHKHCYTQNAIASIKILAIIHKFQICKRFLFRFRSKSQKFFQSNSFLNGSKPSIVLRNGIHQALILQKCRNFSRKWLD